MSSLVEEQAPNRPLDRPETLKDRAYQEIKGQLVSGRLERERLYSAQHFAELLGVSRTPVREALLQLANEGLLVCLDVRGFKIREFSPKEIQDVFETRELIETYVAGRLAQEISSEDVQQLEQSLARMIEHAAGENAIAFIEADRDFHMVLVRGWRNHFLASIMEEIRTYLALFGLQALAHKGRFQEVIREHRAIVNALRQRDATGAIRAVGEHLLTTKRYLLGKDR